MDSIPIQLQTDFEVFLRNRSVQTSLHPLYKKWLRFYLDFCQKYHFSETERNSLDHFLRKLQKKGKQMCNSSRHLMQFSFIMSLLSPQQ